MLFLMELITIFMVVNINVTVENEKKKKKDAWALKNKYGAKLNPFIEITLDGKFYTMIYSEVSEDPVKDLKNTLFKLNKVINTISS